MADQPEVLTEVKEYGNERIEVIYRKLRPSKDSGGRYPELAPSTTVEDGILIERDVAVPMRDGVVLYTDIYRPEGAINVPAIVPWSPYGKSVSYLGEGPMPGVFALAKDVTPTISLSGWQPKTGATERWECRETLGSPSPSGLPRQKGRPTWPPSPHGRDLMTSIAIVSALAVSRKSALSKWPSK